MMNTAAPALAGCLGGRAAAARGRKAETRRSAYTVPQPHAAGRLPHRARPRDLPWAPRTLGCWEAAPPPALPWRLPPCGPPARRGRREGGWHAGQDGGTRCFAHRRVAARRPPLSRAAGDMHAPARARPSCWPCLAPGIWAASASAPGRRRPAKRQAGARGVKGGAAEISAPLLRRLVRGTLDGFL